MANYVTIACREISELKPLAQNACSLFMAECKKNGINIFITETYRSQARQNFLYEQGRTRPGVVVTWTKTSNHTGRMAWDIACSPPLRLYDSKTLNAAGKVAKRLGITWGGTWVNSDAPHFEIKSDWKLPKIDEEDEMIYNYIDNNMPDWARATVQKLVDKGLLKGDEKGNLGLNDTMLKLLVINDRAGLYGK